jgi:uncharacterized membrane protein YdjX (TVP38/TMEM64 family)
MLKGLVWGLRLQISRIDDESMTQSPEPAPDSPPAAGLRARGSPWRRLAILVIVIGAIVALGFLLGDELSLTALAQREAQFRALQQQQPVLVYVGAFVIYVIVTGLSLPGATAMSLLIGWLFGFWRALILVSFASTSGATLAFLLSRYLLRDWIQGRFGDRLQRFNDALDREGAFYLFTLRLIPAVPFFVINAVMGLTRIPVWTFWWVSQVGMLAGTCVYVYAGSTVPDLKSLAEQGARGILSPQLFVAFAGLGLFPLVARRVLQRLRPQAADGTR